MKLNNVLIVIFFLAFVTYFITMNAIAAVESHGEINVKEDDEARIPAGSTVTLIITLGIDRSLAEPGEEIKTFEVVMPYGFETKPENFKSITRNGQEIQSAEAEVSGRSLRIVLGNEDIIADFSSSIIEIIFDAKASDTPDIEVEFRVLMRNLKDLAIGDYIKPGNADSEDNNNSFTLQIVPNKPPEPVSILQVEANPDGENDVIVRWEKSNDVDVRGYWVYRDNVEPVNVSGRDTTSYRDFNVSEGIHEYSVAAYKTPLVKSDNSESISVEVKPDQSPPSPPAELTLATISGGIRLNWKVSPSHDVVKYAVSFGTSEENVKEIETVDTKLGLEEYEYTHNNSQLGKFLYAVAAIDEAGNQSEKLFAKSYILREPYPNPFTPLSQNEEFNKVIFSKRALENVEGEFSVKIYSLDGILVKELIANPGDIELAWDGRNEDEEVAESGIYVYQMQVGDSYKTGTIILAK